MGCARSQARLPRWNVWVCGVLFCLSLVSVAGQWGEGHPRSDPGGRSAIHFSADPSSSPACGWCVHFRWSAVAAMAFGWPPILRKAWGALRNVTLDINILMSLAAVGGLAIGEFVEASAIVFLFSLSVRRPLRPFRRPF
jgi:cation transport ATPase